jgi:hypothetical protein
MNEPQAFAMLGYRMLDGVAPHSHHSVLACNNLSIVDRDLARSHPKPARGSGDVSGPSARNHRFGRGTPCVYARPAELTALDQDDVLLRLGQTRRERHTRLSAAYHHDIRIH